MSYSENIKNFKTINFEQMRFTGFMDYLIKMKKSQKELVDKKNGWKNVEVCPLCGASEAEFLFDDMGIQYFKCLNCTLRYCRQIPVNTSDVYSSEEYLPSTLEDMKNSRYKKERFGFERVEIIKSVAGDVKGLKLLDIGCGTGWFLEAAKESGFEIYGQDIGKELSKWTGEKLGAKIWSCDIGLISDEFQMDIITMFDVIEHVEKPLDFLLKAKRLLKKGGKILIFTPNFDSLAVEVMKQHSNIVWPGVHLLGFTRKSIESLAQNAGMRICYYATCGIDMGDMKSYFEWKKDNNLSEACVKLYDLIQPALDAAGAGNHLRVMLEN